MRNNSQNAGCILRLPASHSCHPRMVQWMSAAAEVCEIPAASRAARISSGVGFAAGPFGPRFGWLGTARTEHETNKPNRRGAEPTRVIVIFDRHGFRFFLSLFPRHIHTEMRPQCAVDYDGSTRLKVEINDGHPDRISSSFLVRVAENYYPVICCGHFKLLPLVTRGAVVVYPRLQYRPLLV